MVKDINKFNFIVDNYTELILKVIHYHLAKNEFKDFVLECYDDVLLVLWNNIDKIDEGEDISGFIKIVSKNKAIDYLRKLMRIKNNEEKIFEEFKLKEEKSAELKFMDNLSLSEIKEIVNAMDSKNIKIFKGRFILDKSVKDIAYFTGFSTIAIYKRIEKIKKEISKYVEGKRY